MASKYLTKKAHRAVALSLSGKGNNAIAQSATRRSRQLQLLDRYSPPTPSSLAGASSMWSFFTTPFQPEE